MRSNLRSREYGQNEKRGKEKAYEVDERDV